MIDEHDTYGKLKVLSVEDSDKDSEIIFEMLHDAGYDVTMDRAEKEQQMISYLQTHQYDIVLADFNLAGFNGFSVLEIAAELCPDIPVVIVSGSIGEETAIALIKSGAVDYVLKDRPARLPLVVKKALDEVKIKQAKRNAEQALMESELHFRTLADSGYTLIWTSGVDGKCDYFNQPWLAFTGRDFDEEIGDGWLNNIHPEDITRCVKERMIAFNQQERYRMEYRIRRFDGEYRWFIDEGCPRYNLKGAFLGYIGHCLDITERKRSEDQLRTTGNFLRTVLSNAPITIFTVDKDRTFTFSDGKALERVGVSPGQNVGISAERLFGRKSFMRSDGTSMNGKEIIQDVFSGETINAIYNLSGIYFDNYIGPLKDSEGNITGIVGVATDITERKLAEDTLAETLEKYRLVFNTSVDAILISSPDGRIFSANPAACNMFLKTEEEICSGGREGILDLSDQRLMLALDERRTTGKFRGELLFHRADGSRFPADVTSAIFKDESGVERSGMIIRDMSERKKEEEQLLIAKEKAEESDRLKTAFLHNVSHEIRTPLNAIVGFSELLVDQDTSQEESKKYIDIINQSNDQLLSIINGIVNIASIEAGQEKVVIERVNVNLVLKQVHDVFTIKAKKTGIQFSYQTPLNDSEAEVYTDKTKLIEILTNLVSNALKFTMQGAVSFGYTREERAFRFFVSDSGVGIPSEMFDEVFVRFRKLDQANRKVEGSGLGLTLSKAYTEMLGGKIWLESNVGQGSVFYFTIPVKTEKPE